MKYSLLKTISVFYFLFFAAPAFSKNSAGPAPLKSDSVQAPQAAPQIHSDVNSAVNSELNSESHETSLAAPALTINRTVLTLPAFKPWLAVDVYAPLPTENAPPEAERFKVRTLDVGTNFEFNSGLSAVVDIGGRDDRSSLAVALREGYVLAKLGSLRADLRAGRFFLNIGALNRLPVTQWPFPGTPISRTTFFAEERAADSGAELTAHFLDLDQLNLTVGLTNGYWYGTQPITGGDKPLTPTHYLRPNTQLAIGDGRLDLGFDYLSRVDSTGERTRISGVDLTFHRGAQAQPIWLTMLEANHRFRLPAGLPIEEIVGGFLYNQARVNDRFSAGLRLDAITNMSLTNSSGSKRDNLRAAFVPVLAYRLAPNADLRGSYTYVRETLDGNTTRSEQRFEVQFAAQFSGSQVDRPLL